MKLLILVCIVLMIEAVYSTACTCGSCGVITAETDTTIYSHSGYMRDEPYPNNHLCSDQIVPSSDKCAQVDVMYLRLNRWHNNQNRDHLYFVDNYPSGDVVRGFFTDELMNASSVDFTYLPDTVYGKPGIPLTLRFETDHYDAFNGYELTVRVGECPPPGPPTCACGDPACGTLSGGVTEVTSPNYPFNYEDYTDCVINIVVPEHTVVRLTMTYFWIEYGYDDLYVERNGVRIDSLTGFLQPGTEYEIAPGSSLHLIFHTDLSVVYLGFSFLIDFPRDLCPDSCWYYYGGHCYRILTDHKTWDKAMSACTVLDPLSYLVQFETRNELDFIRSIVMNDNASGGPNSYWTSGHMVPQIVGDNSGTWYWGDDSPIQNFFWGSNEPNFLKGKEFCMNILGIHKRDFEENDSRCNREHAYICERPV